ncbi:ketoacyl-ACP synthase III [Planococcus sp. N028]|uniref:Beta-ketoacyl-[acyl-carrier-protein] synthase III n=1 Tax=Planococcus shixiaomingii TaxID=3058393 RepID=A0ABT8MZ58_9BACL|nr:MULTISPECIES: ketoacyl-ACP synthase III [unclassified Planococcus (in: firmicutes)]MDN7240888.1 ketoacyl-ACP synthase III [Planococcus sp. N028]WKA53130.1 ketoacyl-ACP synthase III [Planococcus sp. N022]
MNTSKARITAIGTYVPEKRLTNRHLEELVDTNNEWIVQRTGIKERRIAEDHEFTSDISIKAVENLMERYQKSVDDVDMIIVCTMTPDFKTPSVSALVQAKLGIQNTGALDLNAACAGFTYGLHVANGLVTAGLNKKVLVIGAETFSKILDYTDRSTCILFGDGGGAVLVEYDEQHPSFIGSHIGTDGELGKNLYCTDLSNRMHGEELPVTGFIAQNGREVYKWAVSTVPKGITALLEKTGVKTTDVDWFVPHSANLRIIESICQRSELSIERAIYSLEYFGNTSAATIPLSLDKGVREGNIKKNDKLLLYGFGGGLTHAGTIIEWSI